VLHRQAAAEYFIETGDAGADAFHVCYRNCTSLGGGRVAL
jgi:hypothetical protein